MKGIQEAAEIVEALKDEEDLETGMKSMLDDLPKSKTYTFPRVPVYIRKGNKKFYDSMSLSIGPYHHGREHLQAMEKHKWQYLQDLLSRRINKASLGDCLRKMKTLEEEARRCYSESIALKSDEFVKMMVLDSCFIIELFWKFHEGKYFNRSWGFKYIPLDLLLIENQIPFFVIEELFKLVVGRAVISSPSLNELIKPLFRFYTSSDMQSTTKTPPAKILHLLHHFYHYFVPTEEPRKSYHHSRLLGKLISLLCSRFPWMSEKSEYSRKPEILIPSASVLHEAGVIFRKKDSPRSILDITFRNGLMEIPFLKVDDSTKPLFTNLIAFEQLTCSGLRIITSYCGLINALIDTEKDVAILQRCEVIENLTGSGKDLARFFNQLCEYAIHGEYHYFSELFKQVNHYRNSYWRKQRTRFYRDYFSNAALVLLVLTFLQTFFAVYACFRPQ